MDRVIRQMHEIIAEFIEHEVRARHAQITFFEEEQVHVLVKQHPNSNVKFALSDQQRCLNVLLDYECLARRYVVSFFQALSFIQIV